MFLLLCLLLLIRFSLNISTYCDNIYSKLCYIDYIQVTNFTFYNCVPYRILVASYVRCTSTCAHDPDFSAFNYTDDHNTCWGFNCRQGRGDRVGIKGSHFMPRMVTVTSVQINKTTNVVDEFYLN